MKLVEFTRDFLPQRAGETRVLPDALADRLIAHGDAKPRPSVFDGQKPVEEKPAPRGYLTRKLRG